MGKYHVFGVLVPSEYRNLFAASRKQTASIKIQQSPPSKIIYQANKGGTLPVTTSQQASEEKTWLYILPLG